MEFSYADADRLAIPAAERTASDPRMYVPADSRPQDGGASWTAEELEAKWALFNAIWSRDPSGGCSL